MINEYGGKMPDAIGIPEEQLRQAAQMAVCKINIDSDIRLAITAAIREYFAEHPDHFDPAPVPQAGSSGRQGHGYPQADQCSGLQRQGI